MENTIGLVFARGGEIEVFSWGGGESGSQGWEADLDGLGSECDGDTLCEISK